MPKQFKRLTLAFNPITPYQSPLGINNLFVQFQSYWAKTEICLKPTMFQRQSTKGDLNLWLWPKNNRIPPLMMVDLCMKFEGIGQKFKSVSSLQGKVLWNHALTHSLSHVLTQPPTNSRINISSPTLFRGENELGLLFSTSQRTFSLLIWCFNKTLLILPPKFNTFTWKTESIWNIIIYFFSIQIAETSHYHFVIDTIQVRVSVKSDMLTLPCV